MTDLLGENIDIEGVRPMSHKIVGIVDAGQCQDFFRICKFAEEFGKSFLRRTKVPKPLSIRLRRKTDSLTPALPLPVSLNLRPNGLLSPTLLQRRRGSGDAGIVVSLAN